VVDHAADGRDRPAEHQCCTAIASKVQLSEVENPIDRLLEGEVIWSININISCITYILVYFDLLIWIVS
jgi:hypothetical protein